MSDFPEVKDHLVANPDNYDVIQNADGTWTIRPTWVDNPSEVLQEGTPVNAAFLAKIPEAIDAIDTKVTSQLAEMKTDLKQRGINILAPPPPLVAAKGDGSDETTVLQNLLNAASGSTLYWPKGSGAQYVTGELAIPSNIIIIFGHGVVVKAKLGISTANVLFRIRLKNNISIFGNFATFIMNKNEYASSYNYLMYIGESENIFIEKVTVKDAPMDGFYIGGNSADTKACKNITLKEVTTENCKRNGVSITYAENVNLIDCNFNSSSGMNPQAGIDIEPNTGTYTKNISVLNCRASNNANSGFVVSAIAEDVNFDNCRAYNNGASGFTSIVYNNLRPKDVRYRNCVAKGNTDGYTIDALDGIEIVNCVSDNNNQFGINVTSSTGIRVKGNRVEGNATRGITVSNSSDPIIEENYVINNGSAGIMTSGGAVTNPIIRNNYTKDNGANIGQAIRSNLHISGCSKGSVLNNVCRTTLGTVDTPIGLNVTNNAFNTFLKDNDCFEGGVTGIYIDAGSSSVNAGNRNKGGTYSTTAS